MTDPTQFDAIVEHLSNPLTEKKANFWGCLTGIMVATWLICIVPFAWFVYHWAF